MKTITQDYGRNVVHKWWNYAAEFLRQNGGTRITTVVIKPCFSFVREYPMTKRINRQGQTT